MANLPNRGHEVVAIHRHARACSIGGEKCIPGTSNGNKLKAAFRDSDIDAIVIAGAADSREDSTTATKLLVQGNVEFPSHILAAAHEAMVNRLLIVGSSWQEVRGDGFDPKDLYAATKQAFKVIASHFANKGFDVAELQLFETYGPGDTRSKVYNLILDAAIRGETIGLSPGEQELHLVHVIDVCAAVDGALTAPHAPGLKTYSVDAESAITVTELANLIKRIIPDFTFQLGHRKYREGEIMKPASQYPRPPKWNPEIPLEVGLRECVARRRQDDEN